MTEAVNGITIKGTPIVRERREGGGAPAFRNFGEIIKATVVSMEKSVATLRVDENFSFNASRDTLKGDVRTGDVLSFEIVDRGNNSVTLKQIAVDTEKQNTSSLKAGELKDIMSRQGLSAEKSSDDADKTDETIGRIKRTLSSFSGNSARDAMRLLIKEGIALEEISLDMLNAAMRETELAGGADVSDETVAEPVTQVAAAPPNVAYDTQDAKTDILPTIKEMLTSLGLSLNRKNVESVVTALDKWKEIKEYNDEAIITLLRAGKELTLENIYKAKYAFFATQGETPVVQANMPLLDAQIELFLRREGFIINEGNMEASRLLIAGDIPLTAANLNKALFLRQMPEYDEHKMLAAVCESLKNGKRASDTEIYTPERKEKYNALMREYADIIRILPRVTPVNIEFLLKGSRELTLKNITLINHNAKMPDAASEEAITAKRRLAEIQMRLTQEAAARLAQKNININMLPLTEALDTLKAMERLEYEKALGIMGAPQNAASIARMAEIMDKTRSMQPTAPQVYGDIIQKHTPLTINGITQVEQQANEGYEKAETQVMHRYGDSFTKVEGQFADLLRSLNIAPTPENQKAAAILSKTGIDVTLENILRVSNIAAKIEAVADRLHPFIAADMIRANENPVDMHLDELLARIDNFDNSYGNGVRNKLAKYIMEMDNAGVVSDITRNAVIGVYRMLSLIQKDGAAALGLSLKNEDGITLSELYSDAKHYQRSKTKKTDIDTSIGENKETVIRTASDTNPRNHIAEALERNIMAQTEENIQMATNAAEATAKKTEANAQNDLKDAQKAVDDKILLQADSIRLLIKKVTAKAGVKALAAVIEKHANYLDMPLGELAKAMESSGKAAPSPLQSEAALIKDIQPGVVMWLVENNIPVTIGNLFAASDFLKKPHRASDYLNNKEYAEALSEDGELISEDDDLWDRPAAFLNTLDRVLDNSDNGDIIKKTQFLQRMFELANNGSSYQTPVKLHNKYGCLNLYILNDNINTDSMSLYLGLDTTSLGDVSVRVDINENVVDMRLSVSHKVTLFRLESGMARLKDTIRASGYEVGSVLFELDEKGGSPYAEAASAR